MKNTSKILRVLVATLLICVSALVGAERAWAQTWIQLIPNGALGSPPARNYHTAVYDPQSNRMIVFGGNRPFQNLNDVWVLTNANGLGGTPQWIQLFPSGSIPLRWLHVAGYDSANNRMIVFGGGLGFAAPCANDVWVLTNANGLGGTPTWTQLATGGMAPSVRVKPLSAYAQALNRLIVAGGWSCGPPDFLQDAFVLSTANGLSGTPTWSNLAPSGAFPLPNGFFDGPIWYDAVSDRLITAGADLQQDQLAILSAASGNTGTATWSTLKLAAGPTINHGFFSGNHTAVYNPLTNRATFFSGGGTSAGPSGATCPLANPPSNQTWRLDNANAMAGIPTWTQVTTTGGPPPGRSGHTAVYDAVNDRMIVFGGKNDECTNDLLSYFNDVWVLTNATGQTAIQSVPALVSQTLFGGSADQFGSSIALDGSGLYVSWSSSFPLSLPAGTGLLRKYSVPPSTLLWSQTLANTYFAGVEVAAGTVYVAGAAWPGGGFPFSPPACGAVDNFGGDEFKTMLARYTPAGDFLGCISISHSPSLQAIEGYHDVTSETVGPDTFIYTSGNVELCGGVNRGVVAKFTAAGGFLGAQIDRPCTAAFSVDMFTSDVTFFNGHVYRASGAVEFTNTDQRPTLWKYDPNLQQVWRKRDTTRLGSFFGVSAIDGFLYAVGGRDGPGGSKYLIEKYGEAGNVVWSRTHGGAGLDSLTSVVGIGGRLYAVGTTNSQGAGGWDIAILQLDPANGDLLSTTTFGGPQDDFVGSGFFAAQLGGARAATDGSNLFIVGSSRSFTTDGNGLGQSDVLLLHYSVGVSTGNTLQGTNVSVQTTTGTASVTLTFTSITRAGNTTLTTSGTGQPPPAGFKLGSPPTYYELSTTALFSGPITVCINYTGISFGNESNLKLFHLEGSQWVDSTLSLDTTNNIICALVGSLSPFAIFEANTPPSVSVTNAFVTADEGQTAANTGAFSDANNGDNVTITVSVGSVTKTGTNTGTWSWSFATTDGPAQSQTVTVTADDGNGGITKTSFTLTVSNVAPTATFNAPTPVNEGTAIALSLTSPLDPSSVDTTAGFEYAFDCGDGAGYGAYSNTSTASCPTTDNGTRTVKGKIRDKDGGESEYTASVTVNNVAPVISGVTGPTVLLALGTAATVSATFTDVGTQDTHTCTFSWDDGSPNTTVAASGGSCSASRTYAAAGVYTVGVTVTDDDTGSATSKFESVIIYVSLIIDEDSIDNGTSSIENISFNPPFCGAGSPAVCVNDDIANPGVRVPLFTRPPANAVPAGTTLVLPTGQVGDEGLFRFTKPDPQVSNQNGATFTIQEFIVASGAAADENNLDKVAGVVPLGQADIEGLRGRTVCAVVYDSDISADPSKREASLKGATLGLTAFTVTAVNPHPAGGSYLPLITVDLLPSASVTRACGR